MRNRDENQYRRGERFGRDYGEGRYGGSSSARLSGRGEWDDRDEAWRGREIDRDTGYGGREGWMSEGSRGYGQGMREEGYEGAWGREEREPQYGSSYGEGGPRYGESYAMGQYGGQWGGGQYGRHEARPGPYGSQLGRESGFRGSQLGGYGGSQYGEQGAPSYGGRGEYGMSGMRRGQEWGRGGGWGAEEPRGSAYGGEEPWRGHEVGRYGQGMSEGMPHARGRGPKGYKRSDERIREDVCDRLTDHPEIDASEVSVQVSGGEVTLTGTVHERRMKHLIEQIVDQVSGVMDITNQIRVKRPDETKEQREIPGMSTSQARRPTSTA